MACSLSIAHCRSLVSKYFYHNVYKFKHLKCKTSFHCFSSCGNEVLSFKSLDNDMSHINTAYLMASVRNYAKRVQGKMSKAGGKLKTSILSDDELSDVINISEYRSQLELVKEKMKQNFVDNLSVHTTAGSIDKLLVTIENDQFPLNELAQISKKNQNLVSINMAGFPEGLKPALQAIVESGMGLNPQQEGTMIYLSIPKVTREHRETLSKNAKNIFTKTKDEVRHVQNHFVREAKKQTELSEDLVFNATNQIMQIAEQCIIELEKLMKQKQKDLLGSD